MQQLSTITTKGQITIPASIARRAGFKKRQKVAVFFYQGGVLFTPIHQKLEELAGSVKVPSELKKVDIDKVIELAKREYFSTKK